MYSSELMLIRKSPVVPYWRVHHWMDGGHSRYHQNCMSVDHLLTAVRLELHAAITLGMWEMR